MRSVILKLAEPREHRRWTRKEMVMIIEGEIKGAEVCGGVGWSVECKKSEEKVQDGGGGCW